MKKVFLLCLLFSTAVTAYSQSLTSTMLKDVSDVLDTKLKQLCGYVENVGNSFRVKGALPKFKRLSIINNDVPVLFLNYEERYVTVTNVTDSKGTPNSIDNWLRQLANDSQRKSITAVYRLRLAGGYFKGKLTNPKEWKFIQKQADGACIYQSNVTINQETVMATSSKWSLDCDNKESSIYKKEEIKKIHVYLVTDGTESLALLGDIYSSEIIK